LIALLELSHPSFSEATRPNIVLIMADDMGWSDAGCYGGEIRTPSIDRLADEGMRFTQFYNNSICGPTRASLLTGLYCQQVGHPGNRWNEPIDYSLCANFAELLQDSGYHTMMVGKWQGRDLAVHRGFDRFYGPNCQNMISYFNEVQENPFFLNDQPWEFPKEGFYLTDAFTDFAVRFLDEAYQQERPFLLYVAHIAPHWPLHAREKDIAPYRKMYLDSGWDQLRKERFERQREMGLIPPSWSLSPRPDDIPSWEKEPEKEWQAERMSVYAGQIECMDRGIGRILDSLEKAGVEDNTMVIFLSDNGAAETRGLTPHSLVFSRSEQPGWRLDGGEVHSGSGPDRMPGPPDTFSGYGKAWANLSNTPLNGFKQSAYEGGVRTPLIVRWPKVVTEGGTFCSSVGHVIDILPTFLDIAGATHPNEFQGRNLLPLEGRSLKPDLIGPDSRDGRSLYWNAREQGVRQERWKLVNQGAGTPWELYDLEVDGGETKNLAESHPALVKDLAQDFAEWEERVGQP
ncbi:MAG: arylsulfatase, partial [Candidatus Omnitrophica bacterium]|nr:arylsulfatase [Candidatus Omnitrophota bacterium]